jgi:hypothetical protein
VVASCEHFILQALAGAGLGFGEAIIPALVLRPSPLTTRCRGSVAAVVTWFRVSFDTIDDMKHQNPQ